MTKIVGVESAASRRVRHAPCAILTALEAATFLVRVRSEGGADELLTTEALGHRLVFRYVATLEWASATLRAAYEAWGCKQEKELKEAETKDPSREELDDWLLDNMVLSQLYAGRILSGFCLPHSHVYLRLVSEAVGWGVYATQLIKAGTYVGEYTGRVEELHAARENGYACSYVAPPYPLRLRVVINAKPCGNLTRFINHSSQHANVEWREVLAGALFHVVMIVRASQDIAPDEQLLVDYGHQYWQKRGGEADL